jgi:putative restriction endonuclease
MKHVNINIYVAVTDNNWFDYLSALRPDEVNFWRPRSTFKVHAVKPGEPFLFKLHRPYHKFIVGGGFFLRHSHMPLSLAWAAFEQKNGAEDFNTFRADIMRLRRKKEPDPFIGCTILTEPFFFSKEEWIEVPANWSPNIMQGKTYNTGEKHGLALWNAVEDRLKGRELNGLTYSQISSERRYGNEYLTRARLGQSSFRVFVMDAYNKRCAMSGERTVPVLQACHIKPYTESGPHRTDNGLFLRSDLHRLFDLGYLTVTKDKEDYRIEVSQKIKEDFHNGKNYYKFHGNKLIVLPEDFVDRPSNTYLEWHNEYKFAS